MQDDRIIRESGTEALVAAIVAPVIDALDYRLVRVKISAQDGLTLQIMAERPDGTMTVEDCETVSLAVSPALDIEDPIDSEYHLEISSPGIDRPLVRLEDFKDAVEHQVRVETSSLVAGRKRFRGTIVECNEASIKIQLDKVDDETDPVVEVPFEMMTGAKLILTDALISKMLRQDKRDRRDRRKNRNKEDSEPTEE